MIDNLIECFESTYDFSLNHVEYKKVDKAVKGNCNLLVNNNISVKTDGMSVKLLVTRTINFDPESLFELEATYEAVLRIKSEFVEKYNWKEIDLATEFIENGDFIMGNILNRISLLIANITASFGQTPFIIPPNLPENK